MSLCTPHATVATGSLCLPRSRDAHAALRRQYDVVGSYGKALTVARARGRLRTYSEQQLRGQAACRQSPAWTKKVLCDTLEALASEEASPEAKRSAILPALYRHAVALAQQRAAGLPGTAGDEFVSSVGERVAVALQRLDLASPPAQQAAYLDSLLHHALSDASRSLDPLGRGPRSLRRRYEAELEKRAQATGSLPSVSEQDRVLEKVVGKGRPALKLLVSTGMGPAEVASQLAGAGHVALQGDTGEAVATAITRRQIATAIASHPDKDVRDYLFKVAAGVPSRRPSGFKRRLGPTLPALIASLASGAGTKRTYGKSA